MKTFIQTIRAALRAFFVSRPVSLEELRQMMDPQATHNDAMVMRQLLKEGGYTSPFDVPEYQWEWMLNRVATEKTIRRQVWQARQV